MIYLLILGHFLFAVISGYFYLREKRQISFAEVVFFLFIGYFGAAVFLVQYGDKVIIKLDEKKTQEKDWGDE